MSVLELHGAGTCFQAFDFSMINTSALMRVVLKIPFPADHR